MTVGQDQSVRCEDESRTAAAHFSRSAAAPIPARVGDFTDFDKDHGRTNRFGGLHHGLRVGVEKIEISVGDSWTRRVCAADNIIFNEFESWVGHGYSFLAQ